MTTTMSGRIPRWGTKPRQKRAGSLNNLSAPQPVRLPNPKPTTINKPDSRYERGTTGVQVTPHANRYFAEFRNACQVFLPERKPD